MVRGLNLACDTYLTEQFGIEALKKRIELTLNNPVPTPSPTCASARINLQLKNIKGLAGQC